MCVGLGWATVSMAQAATTSYAGILTCRLFLGIFEAAYAPGIPLFLVRNLSILILMGYCYVGVLC